MPSAPSAFDSNFYPRELPIYLTQDGFCERYHVAPRTAERWRITGDGPQWIRAGRRRIIYRLSDCEAWAESRRFAHRADELSRSDGRSV
jgi:hypothetical protein